MGTCSSLLSFVSFCYMFSVQRRSELKRRPKEKRRKENKKKNMPISKMAVFVVLLFGVVAAKQPSLCTEPKDSHGLTCSHYLKSGVGSSCIEMFEKFGFIEKNNLHCQCAC